MSDRPTEAAVIRLVATREIRERLRSRFFVVFTALIAVAVLAIGIVYRATRDDSREQVTVAVVQGAPDGLNDALTQAGRGRDLDVRVRAVPVAAAARHLLADGKVDAAVVSARRALLFQSGVDSTLRDVVAAGWHAASAADAAAAAGLDPAAAARVLDPPSLRVHTVEPPDEDDAAGLLVGFITAVILFISVQTFGGSVLTGVVEEKTTAVVEVLLARVRAHELLGGKVLGIGIVALIQLAAALVAGAIALTISGAAIPGAIWVSLPTTLLWFAAGFALYSTLFALAGSFVSRTEDAQSAAAPISLVFLAAYLLVFTAGADPTGTLATVLSLLPPFAPLLMPLRIATGAASIAEIVVSAVLLLLSTYVVLRLAGRIYARTLLHRGSRISWKDAVRLRDASR
jgi:ABC-2 type transport system permease protein